ncbi:hypothetical protein J4461_01085 [Candidatus Pacearchaeota archaeon]|nr:hypothetical protein [Candidatus Pacearchaeota archaeon]
MIKQKNGQIWIETVLYTLIGLALIGAVMSFAYPKINETREKILIEQTIASLHAFDEVVRNVAERGPGNVRSFDMTLKKGSFIADGKSDKVSITINGLTKPYSEPGVEISNGPVTIKTEEGNQFFNVILILNYGSNINITHEERDDSLTISPSPTIYRLLVENRGIGNNLIIVDIHE